MKRIFPHLAVLIALLCGVCGGLAQTMNNPGLEAAYNTINVTASYPGASMTGQIANGWGDNSNWADVNVVYAQETAGVHGGASAQRIEVQRVGTGVGGSAVQFKQDFTGARAIQPNRVYTMSVWLRASAPVNMGVGLRSTANVYYFSQTVAVGTTWQQFTVSGSGPAAATDSYWMIRTTGALASTGVTVWVDDAMLTFNQKPTVSITAPAANATFPAPAQIAMTVNVADSDGTVAKVEFFDGATKLGESTSAPFSFTTPALGPGAHALTAKATDNTGGATTSTAVSVTVTGPLVSVAASDANASENGDPGEFTFTRDVTDGPLTVSYALAGSALAGSDFTASSGTVSFTNGAATATLTITPLADYHIDSNDTVIATVVPGATYGVTGSSASVTIADTTTSPYAVLPKNPLPPAAANGYGPATRTIANVVGPGFAQGLRIVTPDTTTANIYADAYGSAARLNFTQPVTSGDSLVWEMWVRTISGDASGNGYVSPQAANADGATYGERPTTAGSAWRKVQVPFTVAGTGVQASPHLYIYCGFGPQTVEIGSISLVNYGPVAFSALPIELYEGRAANAAWRTAAAQRIDQHRKSDLTVTVSDLGGNPVPGATVRVKMKRHAFGFGSAVVTGLISQSTGATEATQVANTIYREKIKELFNWAVLENGLKWPVWESGDNAFPNAAAALSAMDWMRNHRLNGLRGHNLLWPRFQHTPTDEVHLPVWLQTAYEARIVSDGQASADAWLRARVLSHITQEATSVGARVEVWDVINETLTNHDLQDLYGQGEMAAWFQAARTAAPAAKLVLNDYGNHGEDLPHITHDLRTLQVIEQGQAVPLVDGIGLQAHIGLHSMSSPDRVLEVFDDYAALGKEIEITEFDIDTGGDEQLQADYLRDFLTVSFSHPSVKSFLHWGFWEGAHWKPSRALYRTDWSIKPNGQMWKDIVYSTWWTDVTGTADANGNFTVRGFRGDYEITATTGTRTVVAAAVLGASAASVPVVPRELTSVTLLPTADAYVQDGGSAGTNFGAAMTLLSKQSTSGFNRDAYLKFDLSTVPEIVSAKLRLNAALTATTLTHTVGFSAHAVTDTSWSEITVNWNTRPALGAVLDNTNVTGTAAQWIELDVTDHLRAEKTAGRNLVTLGLHNAIATSPAVTITSANSTTNKPQLILGTPQLPVVTLAATAPNAAESGLISGTFTLSRTGDASGPLTVSATATGSATDGLDYSALTLPATFSAGAATLHLGVTLLPDTLAEGSENIILTLASGTGYSLGAPVAATVTLADRPYDAWRFQNGIADVSALADLDGDGFVTLLEYGIAANPNTATRPLFPQIMRTAGALYLTYQRIQPLTEIEYRVEVSSDLVNWNSGAGFVEETVQLDGITVIARDLNLAQSPRRFIQLRIVRLP